MAACFKLSEDHGAYVDVTALSGLESSSLESLLHCQGDVLPSCCRGCSIGQSRNHRVLGQIHSM